MYRPPARFFVFLSDGLASPTSISLKDLKASNTLIGVMTGSIAGAVNILFLPHISMASPLDGGDFSNV
jgi:hypothetical protein